MACVVDTNVLLRFSRPTAPDYKVCRAAVDALLARSVTLVTTVQNVVETWAV